MTVALDVQSLTKKFGGLTAVDDLSFALEDGEFTALIGPNGAGKTTCFNLLGGALSPDAGHVVLSGKDITVLTPHQRARMGIGRTFQIAATFRSMTVRENMIVAQKAAQHSVNDIEMLMSETGIAAHAQRIINELAYGDIKRVELAMALVAQPRVLLLDEPTAGMGHTERHEIMNLISDLVHSREVTVLFTEHDMDAVFGFAKRILVMDQGCLIADGSPEEIRNNDHVQRIYLGESEAKDA